MKQSRFLEMANPEKDEKNLAMGDAQEVPDGDDMSNAAMSTNEHDILWIDAVTDASGASNIEPSDWTLVASVDADDGALSGAEQWIAFDDNPTSDDTLMEDGLALSSIDGLPW